MTRQPHLYDDSTATVTSRQATLFNPNNAAAGDSPLTCCTCGRPMVRTESGYLCCPAGHGKLIDEGATAGDVDQDDGDHADDWPDVAAIVAEQHAARAKWLGHPECNCGACRFTRRQR